MYAERTTVVNETGLHARPAGQLAQTAKTFSCAVTVRNVSSPGAPVNAKSLTRIMGEDFIQGSVIEVAADGDDEKSAVKALIALIDSGFAASPDGETGS